MKELVAIAASKIARKGLSDMSKKNSSLSDTSKIPATLKSLFGPPPLLKHEDPKVYDALVARVASSIAPIDDIELLVWVKDYADLQSDITRSRRLKAALINIIIRQGLMHLLDPVESDLGNLFPPATETVNEEKKNQLEREKRRNPYLMKDAQRYDYDAILANNFEALRPALIAIDEYIAGLERRRDAVSDKIEKRKSSSARLSTESVIDADYEDLSDPPAQPQSE